MIFRYLFKKRLTLFRTIFTNIMDINDPDKLKEVTAAVCQMTSTYDKAKNLRTFTKLVEQAREMQAKMVFFPEACDFISSSKSESLELAETLNGTLMSTYKALAIKHDIWISVGGFHEKPCDSKEPTKTYNTHCIINDKGEIIAMYRKLHLFNVSIPEQNINLQESEGTLPGCNIEAPVNTPIGQVGLGICYDVRFPEFSTILRKLGADVLTYPSAFTHTTGEAHWEMLLRSRAIENQCYVIAAAQAGRNNDTRISHGRAMIIDPWGKIQAELPKFDERYTEDGLIAVASIKKEMIESVRKQMPVFEHRRLDCYNLTTNFLGREIDYSTCYSDSNTGKPFEFANKIIPRNTIFYESIHSVAFTNIRCVVPGHVLIASKRKAAKLTDLFQEEQADLFQTTVKIERLMESVYETNSSSVVCQDGVDAGQTVPHVHIHVMPRTANDFQRNDEIYDALAEHDQIDSKMPLRLLEEMIEEATQLRQFLNNMP